MVWQKGHKLQNGRYVIEKVLGEGGFGITYKAFHTLLKRSMVVKVYTLAASLYYAVIGQRPTSSLDRKLYNKPFIEPHELIPDINEKLNWAIIKGMELEAKDRPQSVQDFLNLYQQLRM